MLAKIGPDVSLNIMNMFCFNEKNYGSLVEKVMHIFIL